MTITDTTDESTTDTSTPATGTPATGTPATDISATDISATARPATGTPAGDISAGDTPTDVGTDTTITTGSKPRPVVTGSTVPYVLATGEGEHRHFLNHLATTKVAPGATGSLTAIEFLAPRGFGPPLHVHDDEDEVMIVIDGEIAFRSGDTESIATAGATVFLPHGVPHTFQVLSETARFTTISGTNAGIPRFDRMVADLGAETDRPALPEPGEIDPGQVAAVCAANGISVLGPPPAPLD